MWVDLGDLLEELAVVDNHELPRLSIAGAGGVHGRRQDLLDQLLGHGLVLVDTDAAAGTNGL